MGERRPIFSTKHTGQKIGYIEGHQAFDLFSRPCANYDHATGLLRNLKTQMIVGYVSLKGSFVGSSSVAEELFPASSQNGGEPLDDTFSSSEHEPFDNGSSQGERELQVQSEPVNLTRPSLQDERASSDPPGLRDVPEQHQHSLRGGWGALSEPDVADERPLDGSSLQGEREQTSGSSLLGEPEPRAEGSSQGESESLATPLEGAALAALSGSREDDPKDSSALRGVDTFMVHLAEYLRSPGAAEAASELSNHDESKPGDTQNASAQNESSSVAIPEPRSINGQESLQTEPASDPGATNIRLVSSKRPSSIRSSQIVKASPKAARVSAVGQTKSAITVPPASTTRSHIQPMRRACSTRSSWLKPRSRERLARTASALNTTAFRSGANVLASVVLPAPGKPIIRIFRCI